MAHNVPPKKNGTRNTCAPPSFEIKDAELDTDSNSAVNTDTTRHIDTGTIAIDTSTIHISDPQCELDCYTECQQTYGDCILAASLNVDEMQACIATLEDCYTCPDC